MEGTSSLVRSRIAEKAERPLLAVALLLATLLGAYVEVPLPFTPVPLTLQTFFVLLSGALLGRLWGLSVQGAYLGLGGAGFAAFAGASAGLFHLLGPTAGYLWAFPAASALAGWGYRSPRLAVRALSLAAGALVILLCGAAWLGWSLGLDPTRAFLLGVAPFLPGEALKVAAVLAAARAFPRRR